MLRKLFFFLLTGYLLPWGSFFCYPIDKNSKFRRRADVSLFYQTLVACIISLVSSIFIIFYQYWNWELDKTTYNLDWTNRTQYGISMVSWNYLWKKKLINKFQKFVKNVLIFIALFSTTCSLKTTKNPFLLTKEEIKYASISDVCVHLICN